jgi:hypothetical protein
MQYSEKHELCAALDLKIQLTELHALDAANLGGHVQGSLGCDSPGCAACCI